MPLQNFGRNIQLHPQASYTPRNEQEVLELLNRHHGRRFRCIGRLHSWSAVIDSDDILLDLRHLNSVEPGEENDEKYVDVGAGCQIKRLLHQLLVRRNWTLPSVGFITEQTIAGVISTGTHGSGKHSLSHYVLSVRVAIFDPATGNAVVREITSGEELRAARCSLGCLGVILSVRMQCRTTYNVEEHFQEYERLEDILNAEADFPLQQFYYVPWQWKFVAQHRRETHASPSTLMRLYHWYRYLVFDLAMHLLILTCVRLLRSGRLVRGVFRWVLPKCVLRNWRIVGPATSQLVMEHELFRHVEIELFVQRQQLPAAIEFLRNVLASAATRTTLLESHFHSQLAEASLESEFERLRGKYCHHYPICVRRVLFDDTLISMASGPIATLCDVAERDSDAAEANQSWYSITLTNYHRGTAREPFDRLAGFLARSMAMLFAARPHWGKLCPMDIAELRKLYPNFAAFQRVCQQIDPQGSFRNRWTEQLLEQTDNTLP